MDPEGDTAVPPAAMGPGSDFPPMAAAAKHKSFAPHVPGGKARKKRKMRGAVSSLDLIGQSNHKSLNDYTKHSNHKDQNSYPNDHNSANPKHFHENISGLDRNKSSNWKHHSSTNPKESCETSSPSERIARKQNNCWFRQQQTMHDVVEEETNCRIEGQDRSKSVGTFLRPQDASSNRENFNGPVGNFIQSQRANCFKLWKQFDGAYNARERHVYLKEEELARREQAIRTQEEIVAHLRAQAQAERLEAAHMRHEVHAERRKLEDEARRLENIKAYIERMHNEVLSKSIANFSSKDMDKTHDRGQSICLKMDLSQINYHDAENNANESLETMGDPSQCCIDNPQAKLDVSAKANRHSVGTLEMHGVSISRVTSSYVSEKEHTPHQQYYSEGSEEIVNRALESPNVCAADRTAIGDLDPFSSEPGTGDLCQDRFRFSSSVGEKDSSLQVSRQNEDHSELGLLSSVHSPSHAEMWTCKGTEVQLNNKESSMPMPNISTFAAKVKVEHEEVTPPTPVGDNFSGASLQTLEVKTELLEDCRSDELDHLSLQERKSIYQATPFNMDVNTKLLQTDGSQKEEFESSEACKEKTRNYTVKRNKRKTKTCSIETALEEDAPGLLQVLREKGVVEEIKLYGDIQNEDLLGLATDEDNFKDLESVIEKLWARPSGLIKMGRMRQSANRPTYCLSCLLSLVEQTRSLQNRKWPVEWGWCRQLQSFIFVFERHNRIVLERPEYGFATYFFELVQSLPINWQIGRLVTVMSIAICGRTALLENKPLEIGQDLNAEEASILEDYGWTPNSGLASLLNYCDRVVHDRKVEDDDMEWRSKLGKLLLEGHASGRISIASIPRKLENVLPTIKHEEY